VGDLKDCLDTYGCQPEDPPPTPPNPEECQTVCWDDIWYPSVLQPECSGLGVLRYYCGPCFAEGFRVFTEECIYAPGIEGSECLDDSYALIEECAAVCDTDGDRWFDEDHGIPYCVGTDCDDTDPAVNPDAEEICAGAVDDDCDGLVDEEDPDCLPAEFTLELDASYPSGTLSLVFSIGTPEPATWANYLVLTYPSTQIIPLWSVALPVIDPSIDIPIAFPLPSMGLLGFLTALYTAEGPQAFELAWVDTGMPSR